MKQYTCENRPLLALVGSGKRVLEIGCATGTQTRALAKVQDCMVTGVEIDAAAAEVARPFCDRLVIGDIERLTLEEITNGARYDVVSFADVLEHLRDPVAALKKLQPALNDAGYVVASIPNIVHCAVVYEMAHGRFEYRPVGLLDDTHIRFFTIDSIHRAFEEAGLTVVSIDRLRSAAEHTEFKVRLETPEDAQVLEYIKKHNAEAETYQFVVKAFPMSGHQMMTKAHETRIRDQAALYDQKLQEQAARHEQQARGHTIQLADAERRIRELTETVNSQRTRLNRLDSQLSWTINRPTYRFLAAVSKLLKGDRAP